MRAYPFCLWLVLFTLALATNGLGQLPDHLIDSSALAEAKELLVPLVHSKPRGKSCAQELLLFTEEENDAYWELINNSFFARMAERSSAATTEEVELGLRAVNDRLTEYLAATRKPTRVEYFSSLLGVSSKQKTVEEISLDTHLIAIDLFAQFYILQRMIPRSEDASISKQYMDALLRASLQIDALSLTIVDPFLTPLLERLLAELSLNFLESASIYSALRSARLAHWDRKRWLSFLSLAFKEPFPLSIFNSLSQRKGA